VTTNSIPPKLVPEIIVRGLDGGDGEQADSVISAGGFGLSRRRPEPPPRLRVKMRMIDLLRQVYTPTGGKCIREFRLR
jgi:hypothetical protein